MTQAAAVGTSAVNGNAVNGNGNASAETWSMATGTASTDA